MGWLHRTSKAKLALKAALRMKKSCAKRLLPFSTMSQENFKLGKLFCKVHTNFETKNKPHLSKIFLLQLFSILLNFWWEKKFFWNVFPLAKQVVVVEIPNLTFQVKPKPIKKTVICTISLIMHKKPKYKIDCHVSDFCDYIIVTL